MPFTLDQKFIDELEDALGAKLPASYVAFIRPNNGGTVLLSEDVWELHPIKDSTDRKRIARTANHVLIEQAAYQDWDNAVEHTLTIAASGSGNQLVLVRQDDYYLPEIHRWDHETGKLTLIATEISEAERQ